MRQLKDATLAYVAYCMLTTIPKNAPLFHRDTNGGTIVLEGEIFCRLPGLGSRICGAKCGKDQDELPYHMERMHGGMDKGTRRGQGPRRKKGRLDASEVERLKAFYENVLMKDEDYPGKPNARKRKLEDEQESDSSSASGSREVKQYKVADIPELEKEELRVKAELSTIQRRLAVLKQRKATR